MASSRARARAAGGHRRVRGALVVAEVALALVLLVSSGLLLRSLERLFAVEVGFDSSRLLTLQVQASGRRFAGPDETQRFFAQALEAARGVPGVTAAAFTSQLPLSGDLDEYGVHFEASQSRPAQSYSAFRYAVSPGYLETMRIAPKRGRLIDDGDRAGAPRVALISESLAEAEVPGSRPHRPGATRRPARPAALHHRRRGGRRAAGVAGARPVERGLRRRPSQWHFADNAMSLVVRGEGDVAALAPAVRQAVWSVDSDQPVVRVAMMDDLLAASAAERRFALVLFEAFALAALAAGGRRHLRRRSPAASPSAPGRWAYARRSAPRVQSILALVLRQGMSLTGLGVAIGLAGAVAASQAIAGMLYGVSRLDPVAYLGAVALLAVVALVACAVPAGRAARVDPAETLRSE